MSALEWLLKAAEEVGTGERLADSLVPAMEKIVGKVAKSERPNSEVWVTLAVEKGMLGQLQ